jgi:hypothetical protein
MMATAVREKIRLVSKNINTCSAHILSIHWHALQSYVFDLFWMLSVFGRWQPRAFRCTRSCKKIQSMIYPNGVRLFRHLDWSLCFMVSSLCYN